MIETNYRYVLAFSSYGPRWSRLLLLAPVREWFNKYLNQMFQDFSQENLNEKKEWMQASTYSPLSPCVFFLSSFLKFHSSLPSPTPQRGTTVHLFQFKSAFKYLLNSKIENFPDFYISHCFLSSSHSSICLIIFWTKNSMKFWTRMLEKNTRTTLLLHQRPSCLVLFDSGASSFSQPQAC